jgi:hypothetical protein
MVRIKEKNIYRVLVLLLIATLLISVVPAKAEGSSFGLTVSIISQYYIKLKWDNSLAAKYAYKIEKKVGSGAFVEIVKVGSNTKEYTEAYLSNSLDYTYRIKAYDTTNSSSPYLYSNEVAFSTANYDKPASLTLTPVSSSQIDLAWSYPQSKNYNTVIERKAYSAGTWVVVASLPAGTYNYSDKGLLEDVPYYFRIKAVYRPNVFSDYFTGDSGLSVNTMISVPSDAQGYALSSTQIKLTWTANITVGTGYDIERKTDGSGDFTLVGTTAWGATTWMDSGLTANTRYTYRIRATSGDNYSVYTDDIEVNCVYLAEPKNLSAVSEDNSAVTLSWNDNSVNETGFEIWRKSGTEAWQKYASVDRNVTTFKDSDITSGKEYIYRVKGYILYSDAYSAYSNEAKTRVSGLNAPTQLKYYVYDDKGIELSWVDNEKNETGFKVERKTGINGEWLELSALGPDTQSYMDDTLELSKQYFYRVKVYDNRYYNNISYSNEIRVNAVRLEGPNEVTVTPLSTSDMKITWKDNSSNELGFRIERMGKEDPDYTEVVRLKPNTTSYIDHGLKSMYTYSYRIYAYYDNGDSEYYKENYGKTLRPVQLKDIPENYWAKNEIDSLVSKGIFKLKEGDAFNPTGGMTRGELAHLLIAAFDLEKNKTAVGSYADVKPQNKYYKDIMIADKLGIITKSKGNYFYPDREVSRQDLAVFLAKTLKAAGKPLRGYDISILDRFADRKAVSAGALQNVLSVFGESIMIGVTMDGKRVIAPSQSAARADVAVVLFKVIDR